MQRKDLRSFGLVMAAALILIFGLLLPWIFDHAIPKWPWLGAGVFASLALIWPGVLAPVYKAWMKFGHVAGWINTRIILGLVFFLIVLPIGLLMRLSGKDPMARKLSAEPASYRVPSHRHDPKSLERPF